MIIQAQGIEKSFGTRKVLKGIDLEVAQGEVLSIMGASGAGKSTLLQILGTLSTPDAGSLRIDGTDVLALGSKALSQFRNRRIGFVFQFHHLLPEFTALENVLIPAYIGGPYRLFHRIQVSFGKPVQLADLGRRMNSQILGEATRRIEDAVWGLKRQD
jgi:lipoprotein-releasing system ATP-binding protein